MGGHAVLVREYFLRGFYPSGTATLSDAFSPSGALLKAMLVASSEALTRIIYDNGTVRGTSLADNNQGYGRIELDNSLTFLNATRDGLTLFVKGAADSSSEHYVEMSWLDAPHVYTFRTVADPNLGPLRVVLAYTDVYLASGASTPLANDLDIELTNATHTFYPLVTNQDGKYDRLNPLEMIILENPEPNSTYTVTVTAYSMTTAQSYALVITGEVGGDSNSRSNGDVSSEYWTSSGNVIYMSVALC
ncbi:tagC [Symbiodinium microadriaticum]|nr:tagC [Symbiodinium microadriaticum]